MQYLCGFPSISHGFVVLRKLLILNQDDKLRSMYDRTPLPVLEPAMRKRAIVRLAALFLSVLVLITTWCLPLKHVKAQDNQDASAAAPEFEKGKKAFDKKNYPEALKHLTAAARLNSRSAPVQYYLALAALQNGDSVLFKRALSRIIITHQIHEGPGKQAMDALLRYAPDCKPYPVLNPNGMVLRFVKSQMPIKIYISQGSMLPPQYAGKTIGRLHIPTLMPLLSQSAFFARLPKDPNYQSGYYQCVMRALHKWDWANAEGILSYQVVSDPTTADILVFWCPKFEIPNMNGYTADLNLGDKGKVILQLATRGNMPPNLVSDLIVLNATHELGHCWGLEGHSPNPDDIMNFKLLWIYTAGGGANLPKYGISESDRMTLRALYDIAPDQVK